METLDFNTVEGQGVERKLLIAALNTGTAEAPVWSPMGKGVQDSSMSFEWDREETKDIFDETIIRAKKPTVTQSFDPWGLDSGDAAQKKIWNLAVKDENYKALTAQDMLIVHMYAGKDGKYFAVRYASCSVLPTDLGGEGGGSVVMSVDVVYGGKRVTGTAEVTNGEITFTQEVTV